MVVCFFPFFGEGQRLMALRFVLAVGSVLQLKSAVAVDLNFINED